MQQHEGHLLVGTESGLFELGGPRGLDLDALAGRAVTAIVADGDHVWVLVDGQGILRGARGREWEEVARVEGATCLAASRDGLLVGIERARLVVVRDGAARFVEAFDRAPGRDAWYTPWGDPADVRSIAADGSTVLVNVHVGGILRSADGLGSWQPTLDIDADVHQVVADPGRPGLALAAAAVGLGVSEDGGTTWRFVTEGLHARYCRAVAVAGDTVLVSASTGPGGRRSALYRAPRERLAPLERCRDGLPEWFGANLDTGCVAARGGLAAFGTEDGRVYRSTDAGARWEEIAKGLPPVRAVAIA